MVAVSGLVALGATHYWPLNETFGTTAYDLIGGRHGTYTGTYTLGVAGPHGGAAVDLAGGYVDVAHNADLNPFQGSAGKGSLLCITNPDTLGTNGMLLTKYGDFNIRSTNSGGGMLNFVQKNAGAADTLEADMPGGTVVTGTWNVIVFTYDLTVPRADSWKRSTIVATDTSVSDPSNDGSTNNFQIGRRSDGGGLTWDGKVAHVVMFNIALTASQIDQVLKQLVYLSGAVMI